MRNEKKLREDAFAIWLAKKGYNVEENLDNYHLSLYYLRDTYAPKHTSIDDDCCDLSRELTEGEEQMNAERIDADKKENDFQNWMKKNDLIPTSVFQEMDYYYRFMKAREEEHMWDIDMSDMG